MVALSSHQTSVRRSEDLLRCSRTLPALNWRLAAALAANRAAWGGLIALGTKLL